MKACWSPSWRAIQCRTKIRAYLRDRDTAFQDDIVGLILDTFNDERRAFEFLVNPLGVQMDLTQDEINRNEDKSWDAIWESAGQITDSGFVVEMSIPLSQRRFPRKDGAQTWGFDVVRMYPREHRYRLAGIPQDRALNCYLGVSVGVWSRFGDQIDFANTRLGDQRHIRPRLD